MEQVQSILDRCDKQELEKIKAYVNDSLSRLQCKQFVLEKGKINNTVALYADYWYFTRDFPEEPQEDTQNTFHIGLHYNADPTTIEIFKDINLGKIPSQKFKIDFKRNNTMYQIDIIYWIRPA